MKQNRESGNTLIEVVLAVTITSLLIAVVLSIGGEVLAFTTNTQSDFDAQYEANRAFRGISEVLRKGGWHDDGGTVYPLVDPDLDELQFQVITDIDGNGFPFDGDTGEVEWGDTLFSLRVDPDDETLYVYEAGTVVWTLGRHIREVSFETYREDNTLHFKEIRVSITSAVTLRDGSEVSYTTTGSIHMRN